MQSAPAPRAESTAVERAIAEVAPVRGDYGGFGASRVEVTSRPESIGTAAAAAAPAPVPAPARIAVAEVAAQADPEPAHLPASSGAENVDALRDHVLNALENADQKTIPAMLEAGEWKVQGNEVVIQVSASPTVVELTINNDAQRMLNQFASTGAGRAIKVKVVGGAAPVAVKPTRVSSGNGTSARARAAQDPVVQRMLDKFGGEIRTVMDQRKG